MWSESRLIAVGSLVLAVGIAATATAGFLEAQSRVATRAIVVDGVPMLEVSPGHAGHAAPGVVVAHGFAGSARLMQGFADTLAARGYVVVLPDFTGHGANPGRLSRLDDRLEDQLQHDLDAAVRHLRSLPMVDPAQIAFVGHSMGAGAVTRYASARPDVAATVAISLVAADDLPPDPSQPRNLLLLVGAGEFPAFRDAATRALHVADPAGQFGATVGDPRAGTARRAVIVPGTEHISILYATKTHEEMASWLDASLGMAPAAALHPRDRLVPAALLLVAFVLGFLPLARALLPTAPLPSRDADRPEPGTVRGHYAYASLFGGLVLAAAGAGVMPTNRLPLAVGGYVAGFFALLGFGLVGVWTLNRRARRPSPPQAWKGPRRGPILRMVGVVTVLGAYATAAIAVPTHLGLTHAVPVGARWWLLPVVAACAWLFFAGAELVSAGTWWRQPIILAASTVVLLAATVAGLAPGFILLVLPLLVPLFAWQIGWSIVLRRRSAPTWLAACTGAVVVAWPIATAFPLVAG